MTSMSVHIWFWAKETSNVIHTLLHAYSRNTHTHWIYIHTYKTVTYYTKQLEFVSSPKGRTLGKYWYAIYLTLANTELDTSCITENHHFRLMDAWKSFSIWLLLATFDFISHHLRWLTAAILNARKLLSITFAIFFIFKMAINGHFVVVWLSPKSIRTFFPGRSMTTSNMKSMCPFCMKLWRSQVFQHIFTKWLPSA